MAARQARTRRLTVSELAALGLGLAALGPVALRLVHGPASGLVASALAMVMT